jgi:hypothetical protein
MYIIRHDLVTSINKGGTMRNTKGLMIIALALALMASLTWSQVNTVSAQNTPPVGVVVDYVPEESITIVDQSGMQHQYLLSSSLRILPPGRADMLAVGSFVTIIAPASLGNGKETAVGIVIHPQVPNGWNDMLGSATPLPTNTPDGNFTATSTGTQLATETATATATTTGTPFATDTATATATPPPGGGATVTTNSFVEWLRSLLRMVLSNQ